MIIIQRNRILVNNIKEDLINEFLKKNTIYQKKLTFGYDELWTAVRPVFYEGEPYYALPRNYSLDNLRKYIHRDDFEVIKDSTTYITPKYLNPRDFYIKDEFTLRNELQEQIFEFLTSTGKYPDTKRSARLALFVDTGEGKTFLTLKAISELNHFACIICPTDAAIKTWLEELNKFSNLTVSDVGIVKGSDSLDKVLKYKDKYKIVLISIKTLTSLYSNNKEQNVIDFFNEMNFSIKVFDEFHMNLQSIFNIEMSIVTHKTLYLTATNTRRIPAEKIVLENMTPSDEYVFKQDYVKKFNFYSIEYYTNPEDAHQKGINKANGFDALVYLTMLVNPKYPYRNLFLDNILRKTINFSLKKLSDKESKIAILAKTNEVGEIIGEYISKNYPELKIGYYNSKIKDMHQRQLELENDIIISTDKSFSGIINIPRLEVIVNITPITSESHILQIAGRLRKEENKKRIFIQLVDMSFKKARSMIYREKKIMENVSLTMDIITANKPVKNIIDED